jgi:hypothetical protein
MAIGSALSTL